MDLYYWWMGLKSALARVLLSSYRCKFPAPGNMRCSVLRKSTYLETWVLCFKCVCLWRKRDRQRVELSSWLVYLLLQPYIYIYIAGKGPC